MACCHKGELVMDVLWAPWRMIYINQAGGGPTRSEEECIFCANPQRDPAQDAEQLILYRGENCFVMMNLYPYNTGHLLIAPYQHLSSLEFLPAATATELMLLTQRCQTALRGALNPDGFNLGVNEGKVAGAGFPGHVHLHIVPRWNGDTNFMPVIGDVKVMPEFLQQTYVKIRAHLSDQR
jgi:ATP adenylyltransferase